jgi:tetratricopeptide (TPR) repeat protein
MTILLTSGAPLRVASAADKQINQLELKARESFAAGRYDEALQTFAKLYAETLHPVYLRNIGRCHQKMRDPQKAIDAFKDYLAKSPKSGKDKVTPEERTEIEGYIKEMEALRDTTAASDEANRHAAATPPPVVPIAAPVTAAAPPAAPPPAASEPAVTLTSPPPADAADQGRPVYTRWWFWTIIGVAVVGGTVAAIALSGGGKPHCPPGIKCM